MKPLLRKHLRALTWLLAVVAFLAVVTWVARSAAGPWIAVVVVVGLVYYVAYQAANDGRP